MYCSHDFIYRLPLLLDCNIYHCCQLINFPYLEKIRTKHENKLAKYIVLKGLTLLATNWLIHNYYLRCEREYTQNKMNTPRMLSSPQIEHHQS